MKKTPIFFLFLIAATFIFLPGCTKEDPECLMTVKVKEFSGSSDCTSYYNGLNYIIYIDIDSVYNNCNHIKSIAGVFPDQLLDYTFDISDIQPDYYYIYMRLVDFYGSNDSWLAGIYGTGPRDWTFPAAPNAEVKCGAIFEWEIYD